MKTNMRKALAIAFATISVALAGIAFQDESKAQISNYRIGAICNDGTQSSATGSGACSHHAGVSCWFYSDGSCR
jgi:hypothetical protein